MVTWLDRYRARRDRRRWERERLRALVRASNGEHLPRLERERLNLPDWTA
jgi:hypothetical protein